MEDKRTSYDSLQKILKLVIGPCMIHEIHFPWSVHEIMLHPSLTLGGKMKLHILASPSKHFDHLF